MSSKLKTCSRGPNCHVVWTFIEEAKLVQLLNAKRDFRYWLVSTIVIVGGANIRYSGPRFTS